MTPESKGQNFSRKIAGPLLPVFCWLVLATWLLPVVVYAAEQAEENLQGAWTAAKAERDGKGADDVVGNWLVFLVTVSRSNQRTARSSTAALSA